MTQTPSRPYAGVFDIPTKGDRDSHGVSPSSEAIGGHFGIGWYEYFVDAETREIYRVHCSDGVDGGKGAYTDADERWRHEAYLAVVTRCHAEARSGASEIRISLRERVIMEGFSHVKWLESMPDACDGKQSADGLDGGLVGYCHGVPIICDTSQRDELPSRIHKESPLVAVL